MNHTDKMYFMVFEAGSQTVIQFITQTSGVTYCTLPDSYAELPLHLYSRNLKKQLTPWHLTTSRFLLLLLFFKFEFVCFLLLISHM